MNFNIISIFVLLNIIISINLIICESKECQRELPIKIGEECFSLNCSKLQFEIGECIISNPIIRTQWLNNIILVGEKDFRYISFTTTSSGEMILTTSSYPVNRNRIYFAINSIGEPIFKNSNGENTYIIKKTVSRTSSYERYETVGYSIRINNDPKENKEYFINFGKDVTYTEIFDFINYNEDIIELPYTQVLNANTEIYLGGIINNIEDGINYYYFPTIKKSSDTDYKFFLIKFYFIYDSDGNILFQSIKSVNFNTVDKKTLNCYLISSNLFICLIVSRNYKYEIMYIDTDLNLKNEIELSIQASETELTFFKLIQIKDDIFLFTYYQGIDNDYPIIQIIEAVSSTYNVNLKDEIKLDNYTFNNYLLLTDVILLRENLTCLTSTNKDKEVLIIILINFYNLEGYKYNLRYYAFDIFKLKNHKFLKDMLAHIYNNNLALAFSFCPNSPCYLDEHEHYSSLILFSYPNSTDFDFDIISYLDNEKNNKLIIDLSKYANIDNNIFGYIIKEIKINNIDICNIDYISNIKNKAIKNGDILSKNEIVEMILKNEEYEVINCTISHNLVITEPDYEEYNIYPNHILNKEDEIEQKNFVKNTYEGKIGYFNIIFSQELTKNCGHNNSYCNLCLKNNLSYCLLCQNKYDFLGKGKVCKEETYDIEDIINNLYKNITLSNEQFIRVYNYIKNEILHGNYSKENLIVQTAQVIFQLAKLNEQENANLYISSIDLKKCEKELRDIYDINEEDELIIFKTDIKNEELNTTYVQYEIYDPYTFIQLNLSHCKENEIIINIPTYLDEKTISLYDSLSKSGYNLFDPNDSFYNDICTTYTSGNSTDIILSDRKNIIFKNNGDKVLCQNNCKLKNFNSSNQKTVCECSVEYKVKEPDLNEIKFKFSQKELTKSFLTTLKNSNFLVMKCYKLVFNIKNINKNIGLIIMSIIFILFIILILSNFFWENNMINKIIYSIVQIKFFECNKNKGKKKSLSNIEEYQEYDIKNNKIKNMPKKEKNHKNKKRQKNNNERNRISIFKKEKNTKNLLSQSSNGNENKSLNKNLKNNKTKKLNNIKAKKNKKLNIKKKSNSNQLIQEIKINNNSKSNKNELINNKKYDINNFDNSYAFNLIKKRFPKEIKNTRNIEQIKINKLNDYELNTLEYELALEKDKRTYFEYYWSLLKKKNLILFTFIPQEDYNLLSIKISLFLISFSLYFTINGFFFSDETMHNIYENNGMLDFIFQIQQMLYSTIVCTIINFILKLLSLSEKNILEIKQQTNFQQVLKKSKIIEKYIKMKFFIYFILGIIFLSFFCYFISCFCIVYNNTQIILIEDTLISFGLSMIYPFGLNLIPGFFRIPAIRDKKPDKKCLYKFSQYVSMII